jgi:hypothetical protein
MARSLPLFAVLSATVCAASAAAANGLRDQPNYDSYPGAGAQVEPFYRSSCPADLSTYGGCPVRVYSGPYGQFWSAPPPLEGVQPAPRRRPVHKG